MHKAFIRLMDSYTLVWVFWDELPFTVDAGVRALAGDLLLLLRDAAWRRGRPTCVEGTWKWRKEAPGAANKREGNETIKVERMSNAKGGRGEVNESERRNWEVEGVREDEEMGTRDRGEKTASQCYSWVRVQQCQDCEKWFTKLHCRHL